MNVINPITQGELKEWKSHLQNLSDDKLAAEQQTLHQQLAAARAALQEFQTVEPEPNGQPAGVDLADAGAVAGYLQTAAVTSHGNERAIAAARVLVRNLEKKAPALTLQVKQRARNRARITLREHVKENAELLRPVIDFINEHHELARQVGGRPLLPRGIVGEMKQAIKASQ